MSPQAPSSCARLIFGHFDDKFSLYLGSSQMTTTVNGGHPWTNITLAVIDALGKIFGAGDENRTRVLSLGIGDNRACSGSLIPNQTIYFGATSHVPFIAGTPRALRQATREVRIYTVQNVKQTDSSNVCVGVVI